MQKTFLILYLIFSCLIISAQNNTIVLHPLVGDTIDKIELNRYLLFNEYSIDSIDFIILTTDDSLYFLSGYYSNTLILKTQVNEDLLLSQEEKIEKLDKYYNTANIKDSVCININNDYISEKQVDLNFQTPEFYKSIKKENRRQFWQEKRVETKENQKKGMYY